jgi:hypothetical protein
LLGGTGSDRHTLPSARTRVPVDLLRTSLDGAAPMTDEELDEWLALVGIPADRGGRRAQRALEPARLPFRWARARLSRAVCQAPTHRSAVCSIR